MPNMKHTGNVKLLVSSDVRGDVVESVLRDVLSRVSSELLSRGIMVESVMSEHSLYVSTREGLPVPLPSLPGYGV